VHEVPLDLRADLNVPKTLRDFERELATLVSNAFVAEMEWAEAAKHVEAWKERRLSAEREGEPFFAQQALARQQQEALLASELRLEFEEWEQLVADYSSVIEMLRKRLAG
jgi:phage shock protein A